MTPFTTLRAVAAPLPIANISTDDIFPGPGATGLPAGMSFSDPAKMGPNAFAVMRWNADGSPRPDFILNRSPWDTAQIIVARDNFGCGSSREHAVWCMAAIGMRCVIAPSFGDIFYGNCFKNGMLPVRLPVEQVERLLSLTAAPETATLNVDLTAQTVIDAGGGVHRFEVDAYRRDLLLNGLDEIEASLRAGPLIEAHDAAYCARRPWLRADTA
ncbi:MAG: 3-isopropylmalate dehydratase small subunit [Sphingomonadaceae bacterium]|nr:3-isopropylmalate dehydratase small subunit [Sphingomonadaceae bacterium]